MRSDLHCTMHSISESYISKLITISLQLSYRLHASMHVMIMPIVCKLTEHGTSPGCSWSVRGASLLGVWALRWRWDRQQLSWSTISCCVGWH